MNNGAAELKFREAKDKFVAQWEREFFVSALKATGGNISRAAERVGMYRQSFQQKMRELGISAGETGVKAGGRIAAGAEDTHERNHPSPRT